MAKIEGTRLEAQEITRVLPATEVYDCSIIYLGKIALAIILIFLGLYAGTKLGLTSWLKACIAWSVAAVIAFLPLNNEAIMWMLAELNSRIWSPVRTPLRFDGNDRITSPKSIEVGDYIRVVEGGGSANLWGVNPHGVHSQEFPFESRVKVSGQSAGLRKQDASAYHRVIAKLVSPDSGRVWIGVFGSDYHDTDPADPNYMYYRRKTAPPGISKKRNPQAEKVARALGDLIDLLCESPKVVREKTLGRQLVTQFHHDPSVVRIAFRVAESGWLIDRRCRRASLLIEHLRILNRKAVITGHVNCSIYLTHLGRMWRLAGSDYRKVEFPEMNGTVMGDYNINFGTAGSIGRDNKVHARITGAEWKNLQDVDMRVLAQELGVLRAELRRQETSAEQDPAVAEVALAMLAAEKGDAAEVAANLSKLGSRAAPIRKWIVDTATSIGVPLAVATIKQIWLHMPPGG